MTHHSEAPAWLGRLEVGLVPTFRCNLRCEHCFVAPDGAERVMELDRLLGVLRDAKALGVRSLQVTGGEFFTYPHRLAALQHLGGLGLPVGISTNGTLVERDDVALLAGTEISLCLSLDGPERVHDALRGAGTFARVRAAAAHCLRYGVRFDFSSTVTRRSLPYLRETVRTALELGASAIHFGPLAELGGRSAALAPEKLGHEEAVELLAQLAALRAIAPAGFGIYSRNLGIRTTAVTHPCIVCACYGEYCPSKKYWPTTVFVLPDGEVIPQSLHVHRRYSLGNAGERGLAAVLDTYWQSRRHRRFQTLCRHVYQDLIFGSEQPLYLWDELLREASSRPFAELPTHARVSHPYDHSAEIAAAARRGPLDAEEFPLGLG